MGGKVGDGVTGLVEGPAGNGGRVTVVGESVGKSGVKGSVGVIGPGDGSDVFVGDIDGLGVTGPLVGL